MSWQCVPYPIAKSTTDLSISPVPIKEDIHKNAFKGKAASIQRVADAGHLVPQVKPDDVADVILTTFNLLTPFPTKSRL